MRSLIERPFAAGACAEAELQPRAGSQLPPAQLYAVLLSRHLFLSTFNGVEFKANLTGTGVDKLIKQIIPG